MNEENFGVWVRKENKELAVNAIPFPIAAFTHNSESVTVCARSSCSSVFVCFVLLSIAARKLQPFKFYLSTRGGPWTYHVSRIGWQFVLYWVFIKIIDDK